MISYRYNNKLFMYLNKNLINFKLKLNFYIYIFNIQMEKENSFFPNLSDILTTLEFLFMNPLEFQALPSQLEPLGKKKDPVQETLRTLS